jgi:DnaJ-class molecular chaperone
MSGFVFGQDAPCRGCHGAGSRVEAMSDAEKREHQRAQRRAKREGYSLERIPVTKPCSECGGKGYVPIAVADARR